MCKPADAPSWSVGPGASRLHAPLFVACGCSGVANSPCVDAQNLLYKKDQVHRDKLIQLLQASNTHQEYAKALHDEFVRYAQDKLDFYNGLPEVLRSFDFFVKRAEHNLQKATDYKPRTTFWPQDVFKEYKKFKLDCIAKIAGIPSRLATDDGLIDPEEEKRLRRAAINTRNSRFIEEI